MIASKLRRLLLLVLLVAGLSALASSGSTSVRADPALDWEVPNGHFYTQTSPELATSSVLPTHPNSWTSSGPVNDIQYIAIDPRHPERVYAVSTHQLYETTSRGLYWTTVGRAFPNVVLRMLTVDPVDEATLYLVAYDRIADPAAKPPTLGRLFKTSNRGTTWRELPNHAQDQLIWSVVVDHDNNQFVYLASDAGIYKSPDGGLSWERLGLGGAWAITMHPWDSKILFAATSKGGYRTRDGGVNWALVLEGYLRFPAAISPIDGTIWAEGGATLYRSSDAGSTWTPVTTLRIGGVSPGVVLTDPLRAGKVYVAGPGGKGPPQDIFISEDYGNSWYSIPRPGPLSTPGKPVYGYVSLMLVDSLQPQTLYAIGALNDGRVHQWTFGEVPSPPRPPTSPDWFFGNSRFFTQTSPEPGRVYAVTDDPEAYFRSYFDWLGGVDNVGYPMSQRFVWGGFTTQVMQRAVFQWRPEANQVYFVNVFDDLHDKGFDDWLLAFKSTPKPLDPSFDQGKSWDQIVRDRLALLDEQPAFRDEYEAVRNRIDPMLLYGLPTSKVTDMGNHYAMRLQRAVFQLWKEDVPWARAGEVTVALGGAIAAESRLLRDEAGLFGQAPFTPEDSPVPY